MSTADDIRNLLECLRGKREVRFDEIAECMGRTGRKYTASDIGYMILELEERGALRRIRSENPYKPVTTGVWEVISTEIPEIEAEREREAGEKRGTREKPFSIPVFSVPYAVYLRDPGILDLVGGALLFRDALNMLFEGAREELLIVSPYIGSYIENFFYQYMGNIGKLRRVRIVTEEITAPLVRISNMFPNTEVIRVGVWENSVKLFGIHAKVFIADSDLMLIGSFNLRFTHENTNIDAGVMTSDRRIIEPVKKFLERVLETAGGRPGD